MKITSVSLPAELTERIDQVARDSERSRSFIIRRLLEQSLTAADRAAALDAIATQGLLDKAAAENRAPAPNTTAVISESCVEGRARLQALEKIAKGAR